jgi:hypothetical protein
MVLESEKLLGASILSLLASREEFDVIDAPVASLDRLYETGNSLPDVVIMEETQLMESISAVLKLTSRFPALRLIIFGLSDSRLHVVDQQMVEVRQVSDFLELL